DEKQDLLGRKARHAIRVLVAHVETDARIRGGDHELFHDELRVHGTSGGCKANAGRGHNRNEHIHRVSSRNEKNRDCPYLSKIGTAPIYPPRCEGEGFNSPRSILSTSSVSLTWLGAAAPTSAPLRAM